MYQPQVASPAKAYKRETVKGIQFFALTYPTMIKKIILFPRAANGPWTSSQFPAEA
jgi:hypothetical protein